MKISWLQMNELCDCLAAQLKNEKIERLACVPTSGLIPAQLLSIRLGIKDLRVWGTCSCELEGTLLVDDINDTGKTFTSIAEMIGGADKVIFCAPIAKFHTKFTKGFYGKWTAVEEYITMPWEVAKL